MNEFVLPMASDPEKNNGRVGGAVPNRVVLLHGDLDLHILEARSLPNMDLMSERLRKCFTIFGPCATPLGHADKRGSGGGGHKIITSDPYVSVCLAGATVARTKVIANCENPKWDEQFHVPIAHPVAYVEFQVKDDDVLGAQLIGVVTISAEVVLSGNSIDGWFPIVGHHGNPYKPYPELRLSLRFVPLESNSLYKGGVGGVPNTYFPLRRGGSVTLYQDAHVLEDTLPEILLEGGEVVGTLYTHHQKCVLVDTQATGNNRKITAFIGGLDLCDGRYDTPDHRLFDELDTIFQNDFHNPTFPVNTKGPRQPWHDLHCKIEGPAAYDILTNFEQRWRKATKWRDFRFRKVTHWHDDALIKLDRISWILTPSSLDPNNDENVHVTDEKDPENWHVQNLACEKKVKIDKSIHTACEIQVDLQSQTMEMMYRIIGEALEKAGMSSYCHPQDYLNFYCLGKRESSSASNLPSKSHSTENSALKLAQRSRRFMIYVHAKGMIVDDEYVMMGSANINQRSLDGSRDTEIAMGAYQPHQTWAKKQKHPHGQVYGYRMSLWAEHLGLIEDLFSEPQTLSCVRRVNKLAEENWKAYVSDEVREMKGHLMKYPIRVERDGRIRPLPGHESFPDVGGKVLGANTTLPDALTT
ncbi:Phospholipase D delta [Acorus calamus]|uniref:phospholipase D n=1 Tax=Acorus calamus TaxID=4465 RepID=A0AAV9DFC5_ACOCL|nr:Phospholipase D delta [Acorus calamus]